MMLYLGVIVLMCVVLLLMLTQAFIPIVQGTPLFPMLRRRSSLKTKVAHAREDLGNAELEGELGKLNDQAEGIRHPEKPGEEKPVEGTDPSSTLVEVTDDSQQPDSKD